MIENEVEGMADSNSIEVMLVRMEGKIDRMSDRMGHFERDIDGLRGRLHDFNNAVTPLTMLNLPDRIKTADTRNAAVDARLGVLETIESERKGAAKLAKLMYTLGGVAGTGSVAVLLRIMGTI